jgi:O-acetyl-ADP-ribose deacetylase (regulator of RNase III)
MEHSFRSTTIAIKQGDITRQTVDVIVNPAHPSLVGAEGLSRLIHTQAGLTLSAACLEIREAEGEIAIGRAVITNAGDLPADWVVHTVPPIWSGGAHGELIHLEFCYTRALGLAMEKGAKSIAFPSIGTGTNGFPIDMAAYIALGAIVRFAAKNKDRAPEQIQIWLSEQSDYELYLKVLPEVIETMTG